MFKCQILIRIDAHAFVEEMFLYKAGSTLIPSWSRACYDS